MGAKSSYARTQLVKALLKNTAFTGPAVVYMSLHTADPALNGANEVAGNAYARAIIAFGAEAAGVVSNTPALVFPAPTPANWGTATHFGLWDAVSGGNYLGGAALTNPVATSVGVPIDFPIAAVQWSET